MAGAKIQGGIEMGQNFVAEGALDFVGVKIGSFLMIYDIKSPEKMVLDLSSAKIGTLLDNSNSWPKAGNLFLNGLVYDRIKGVDEADVKGRIGWLHRQPGGQFRPQPYEQLAAVLRAMGYEDEAKKVMIEKNQDRANRTPWFTVSSLWYHGFGHLVGYGYEPLRAVWISIACIVFGTILFSFGKRRGIIGPTDESKAYPGKYSAHSRSLSEDYPGFVAWIYSFETFVPLMNLDMSEHWRPNTNRSARFCLGKREWRVSGWWFCLIVVVYKCFGWILTTLCVGAVTGLIKT